MKKAAALLLSVLMLLGALAGHAEETVPARDFPSALLEWAGNLDLAASDYSGTASFGQNPPYHATVRKDRDILELAVQELGRAQLSGEALALEFNGQKYYVDLASLLRLFQEKAAAFPEDLARVEGWLVRAYQQVILPCIDITYDYSGFVLHIDITGEKIRERTYALVDELMAERTLVEKLLSDYRPLFSLLGIQIPGSYDGLLRVWEAEKSNPSVQWPHFSVRADVTYSPGYDGGFEAACSADLQIGPRYAGSLRAEMSSGGGRLDLTASYDSYGYLSAGSYSLDFHYAGKRMEGKLKANGSEISLEALLENRADGTTGVTAVLTASRLSRAYLQYSLDMIIDPAASALKASLTETRYPGTPDEEKTEIASLDACRRNNSFDAVIKTGYGTISAHLTLGRQFSRLKLSFPGYRSEQFFDLWICYPSYGDYQVRLDSNLFARYRETYDLRLRKNEFSFDILSRFRPVFHSLVKYQPADDGFAVEAKLMDYFLLGPETSTFRLNRSGRTFSADLQWDYWMKASGSANAMLELDESGRFGHLDAYALVSGQDHSRKEYRLSCTADTLTYQDETGVYELKVTENTAQRLEIRLTKDNTAELGCLVLTLEEPGILGGVLTVSGGELAQFRIEPVEKAPVDPISKNGAVVIDREFLEMMSNIWFR